MKTYISIVLLGCVSAAQAQAPTDKETCQKAAMAMAIKLDQAERDFYYFPYGNYSSNETRCYVEIEKKGPLTGPERKLTTYPQTVEHFLYDGETGTELARTKVIITIRGFPKEGIHAVLYDEDKSGTISAPTTPAEHNFRVVLHRRAQLENQPVSKLEQDYADWADADSYIRVKMRTK